MLRSHFVALAALALSVPSFAQPTDLGDLKLELARLDQALSGPVTPMTSVLKLRRERLQRQMEAARTPASAPAASGTSGPSYIVAPNSNTPGACGALEYGVAGATFSFSNSPALAVIDNATVSDTIAVSGVGTSTFDVDVTLAVTHTWCADMQIRLVSPSGTIVPLSSGRGGSNDDVFNGTLFDDQSANAIGSYVFTTGVAAPDLRPEASLNSSLAGEDPNGVWTLEIQDTASGDVGVLSDWSLSITDGFALSIPPSPGAPTTFSTGPTTVAIVDNATVSSPLTISGGPSLIAGLTAYIEVTHTWNADMLIQVQSPAGTIVDLSNRRGGSTDNVFNGTTFSMASPNVIGSWVFTNNVVAVSLRPDGNLGLFNGEDANGTWNLLVNDNASGDVGLIKRFDLNFAAGCAQEYGNYCTAGTSLNGCVPTLSATGSPSAAAANGFVITASGVDGNRSGLLYYGLAPSGLPFAAGYLCIAAPRQRMGQAQFTGGTAGACDGSISVDLQTFATGHPAALAMPLTAGTTLFFQASVRDNGSPENRVMSDAIAVTLAP
ncbi:MAG: proprotein convertase P-domain-containing protein [Planctomycetota bacterium]|nr:proprotein convertase P-domain-containing protein [Planctomycetota bacterium]